MTLRNLVTVFVETKSVTKSRLHCTSKWNWPHCACSRKRVREGARERQGTRERGHDACEQNQDLGIASKDKKKARSCRFCCALLLRRLCSLMQTSSLCNEVVTLSRQKPHNFRLCLACMGKVVGSNPFLMQKYISSVHYCYDGFVLSCKPHPCTMKSSHLPGKNLTIFRSRLPIHVSWRLAFIGKVVGSNPF